MVDIENYKVFTTADQYEPHNLVQIGEKHMNTCRGCSSCDEHGLDAEALGRELEGLDNE